MQSPLELAKLARTAGWKGSDAVTAVAIALTESNGRETMSGGLWRVAGSPADPQGQANAAYAKWRERGWSYWASYRTKTYLLMVPVATAAFQVLGAEVVAKDPGAAVAGLEDAVKSLPGGNVIDLFKDALTLAYKGAVWIGNPNNWARIAQVVLGGALVVGGLVLIGKNAVGTVAGEVAGSIAKPLVKAVKK